MVATNSLDDMLPVRLLLVTGVLQAFADALDLAGGFTVTSTVDPDTGMRTLHVTVAPATVLEGSQAMGDADYNATGLVIPTSGASYVGCNAQFTADRAFWLPPNPSKGDEVTWADECTTAGGSLLNHNVIFKTSDSTEIMAGATGQTGGNTLAATYTATHAAWGTGATITLLFNGTFWKVK